MRICVFCGSSYGARSEYKRAAATFAKACASRGIDLVTGGGHVGLMGIVADSALAAGARVTGVMPEHLVDRELAHRNLSELHIVSSMHERKAKMAELADAFVALPGGAGTLEEIFEQWTWGQLGIHAKPSALLNVIGYFEPIAAMLKAMVGEAFLQQNHQDMLILESNPKRLIERIQNYEPPTPKWQTSN